MVVMATHVAVKLCFFQVLCCKSKIQFPLKLHSFFHILKLKFSTVAIQTNSQVSLALLQSNHLPDLSGCSSNNTNRDI